MELQDCIHDFVALTPTDATCKTCGTHTTCPDCCYTSYIHFINWSFDIYPEKEKVYCNHCSKITYMYVCENI